MPALAPLHHLFRPATRGKGAAHPRTGRMRLQRRVGYRLACGLTPAQAARTEGVEEAQVQALLAEPDFALLVADYAALQDLPEPDLLRRLARRAHF